MYTCALLVSWSHYVIHSTKEDVESSSLVQMLEMWGELTRGVSCLAFTTKLRRSCCREAGTLSLEPPRKAVSRLLILEDPSDGSPATAPKQPVLLNMVDDAIIPCGSQNSLYSANLFWLIQCKSLVLQIDVELQDCTDTNWVTSCFVWCLSECRMRVYKQAREVKRRCSCVEFSVTRYAWVAMWRLCCQSSCAVGFSDIPNAFVRQNDSASEQISSI